MDLNLSLRYQEQNDNKAIVLTDTTDNFDDQAATQTTTVVAGDMYEIAVAGTYNFIALGAANNNVGTRFVSNANATINLGGSVYEVTAAISEIVGVTLGVAFTNENNVTVSKGTIDLLVEFGPFADQGDMVYTIDAALLGDLADSLLSDGLYTLTYTITSQIGVGALRTDILTVTILVYGQVKVAVYQKLRQIPVTYSCNDGRAMSQLAEADLCGAFLSGIESSAYIAKTEELLNMLVELNRILLNGSKITW